MIAFGAVTPASALVAGDLIALIDPDCVTELRFVPAMIVSWLVDDLAAEHGWLFTIHMRGDYQTSLLRLDPDEQVIVVRGGRLT